MGGRLSAGHRPVVTGCAGARHYTGMIHGRRDPASGLVTRVASKGCRNVSGRLSRCLGSVVTAAAGAGNNPCVVVASAHQRPICRSHTMTGIARCRRRQMAGVFSSGLHSIVTGHTGAGSDALMFENSSHPTHRLVATVAGHGRRNMCDGLPDRR